MTLKEWLEFIGLIIITFIGGLATILILSVASAAPVILTIWVIWKLFFN